MKESKVKQALVAVENLDFSRWILQPVGSARDQSRKTSKGYYLEH